MGGSFSQKKKKKKKSTLQEKEEKLIKWPPVFAFIIYICFFAGGKATCCYVLVGIVQTR